jgi:hypothetical protein
MFCFHHSPAKNQKSNHQIESHQNLFGTLQTKHLLVFYFSRNYSRERFAKEIKEVNSKHFTFG